MPFDVLIDRAGDRVLCALSGELGSDTGRRFEEAVEELERGPLRELVVDLSGITFIDSTGAFLLLDLYNRFNGSAAVAFEGAGPPVQRMFEAAGLTGVLPIAAPDGTHPALAPPGGPDHDWTAGPAHPHHAHPYIGLPRRDMPPRHRP